MINKKKFYLTGFAPNLSKEDVKKACSYLFLPWKWGRIRKGNAVKIVENKLKEYFNVLFAFTYDSGRSALYFALRACGAGEGDEVIVQGYTCVVVINAVKWTGAKPIYVDVQNDCNMNPDELESKISNKTKAIIIQHTYGKPADLDAIMSMAKKHNIKVIEDCAHSFGARHHGRLAGTIGDIGMLSFGSDKIISCARGGALITGDKNLCKTLIKDYVKLRKAVLFKTLQHLMHFPVFAIGRKYYHTIFGKFILWTAQKLRFINRIIYKQEKIGRQIPSYPSGLPNSLADILVSQLEKVESNIAHRKKIAEIYKLNIKHPEIAHMPADQADSVCVRYPLFSKKKKVLISKAKKHGLIIGDWYSCAVAPCDIDKEKTGYRAGSCPKAEGLARLSLNLPTNINISTEDAVKIAGFINGLKVDAD